MKQRMGMATQLRTALTLLMGLGVTTTLGACSSTGDSKADQTGGGGGASSTAAASGGSSESNASGGAAMGSAGATGTSTSATGGAAPTGPGVWATIKVELTPPNGSSEPYTSVEGFGRDAAPLPELFKTTKTVGECKLLEPLYPFCDSPKCAGSVETCVAENTCATNPVPVEMGVLTFRGLTLKSGSADSFDVTAIGKSYVAAGSTGVAYPPCDPGKEISVKGGADADTSFTVTAPCIDPLTVTGADPIPFKPNEPTQLTWQAPSVSGNTKMLVRIDISHHGGLKGLIVCETADTGSITVDGSLAADLISLGTAGFPVARLTRLSTATENAGSGKATLNVQSWVERSLEIPGVFSCSNDIPCPNAGDTCKSYKCEPGS